MKNKLIDRIDFEKIDDILEGFNKMSGFASAIIDLEGNVLSKSGRCQICTEFHRKHPETLKKCNISDTQLAGNIKAGEKYHIYTCLNGLVDVAAPIVINGDHIANLITGQFFVEKPDTKTFTDQAATYGFNEESYLDALRQVPIVSEEKLKTVMDFLLNVTEMIIATSKQNLEQIELNDVLKKSEQRFRDLYNNSPDMHVSVSPNDATILYCNDTLLRETSYKREELIGAPIFKIYHEDCMEDVKDAFEQFSKTGEVHNKELIIKRKDGSKIQVSLNVIGIKDKAGKILYSVSSWRDISAYKQVEKELIESKSFFEQLFIQSSTSTQLLDPEGWCIKINPKLSELFGVLPEHIEGKKYNILKDEEIIQTGVINHLKKVFKKKETVRWEVNFDIQHASESTGVKVSKPEKKWFHNIAYPILDSQGDLIYVIIQHEDITESKQVEAEMKESLLREGLLADIVRESSVGIAIGYPDGRLGMCNSAYQTITGYSEEELKHIDWNKVMTPPEWEAAETAKLQELHQTKKPVQYEKEYIRKDGTRIPIELVVNPRFDDKGEVAYYFAFVIDITERKKVEGSLRQKSEDLSALLEISQTLTKTLDMEVVLQNIIDRATKLIGLDTGAIYLLDERNLFLGAACPPIPTNFPDEFRRARLEDHPHIKRAISTGLPVIIQDLERADLTPAETAIKEARNMRSLLYIPLFIEDQTSGVLIMGTVNEVRTFTKSEIDLYRTVSGQAAMAIKNSQLFEEIKTLNKELEKRVQDRTEELKESQIALLNLVEDLNEKSRDLNKNAKLLEIKNKELETFTYSVSHDLKAPLRGIDGYSQLLYDIYRSELNEEAQTFIKTIRSSTLHMNQLIDDLLEYSRLERSQLKSEQINISDLIKSILSLYQAELDANKINVSLKNVDFVIFADAKGLTLALRNLVENAIKFSKDQDKSEVQMNVIENDVAWIVSVEDNGIGFDMKYHHKIFEIFQRLQRIEDYPGTGIGLALVNKAMQRMNGKAWAESLPGKGSTFYLEIPKMH